MLVLLLAVVFFLILPVVQWAALRASNEVHWPAGHYEEEVSSETIGSVYREGVVTQQARREIPAGIPKRIQLASLASLVLVGARPFLYLSVFRMFLTCATHREGKEGAILALVFIASVAGLKRLQLLREEVSELYQRTLPMFEEHTEDKRVLFDLALLLSTGLYAWKTGSPLFLAAAALLPAMSFLLRKFGRDDLALQRKLTPEVRAEPSINETEAFAFHDEQVVSREESAHRYH